MKKLAVLMVVLMWASVAQATVTILDDFEVNEGHFALQPTFSGSTAGLLLNSTADRVTTDFYDGIASQQLVLNFDPAHVAPGWNMRHLSGSGAIANNVAITPVGYTGYWMKTTTPDLFTMPVIDDGAAGGTERGVPRPIIADGQWHSYQWNMADPAHWNAWVGASDGDLDGPTITYDAVWVGTTVEQSTTLFFDRLAYNPEGQVPEPTTLALVGLAGLALVRRRR